MSQKGNYEPSFDLETITVFKQCAQELNLDINTDAYDLNEKFLTNIDSYKGEYRGYTLVLRYKPKHKTFINIQLYKSGYNFTTHFSVDVIKEKGIEWCFGYMAYEMEKKYI